MKNKEKILFPICFIGLVILLILSIISIVIGSQNKRDIEEIKERMGINSDTEDWIDERLDYEKDNSLVGTWRNNGTYDIYLIEINDKGIVTFKYYTNLYNKDTTNEKAENIKTEDIENSEYQLLSGSRGYLENNVIVLNERYDGKEWKSTNASTFSIWKTSGITIKTSKYNFEFTKQ